MHGRQQFEQQLPTTKSVRTAVADDSSSQLPTTAVQQLPTTAVLTTAVRTAVADDSSSNSSCRRQQFEPQLPTTKSVADDEVQTAVADDEIDSSSQFEEANRL
jgi:hypothetical protein